MFAKRNIKQAVVIASKDRIRIASLIESGRTEWFWYKLLQITVTFIR